MQQGLRQVKNFQTYREKYYDKTESEKDSVKESPEVMFGKVMRTKKYVLQFLTSVTSHFLINSQINREK